MNKSILGLNVNLSIIIISGLCALFTFIGGYSQINGIVSFVFVVLKLLVFIVIPLIFYLLEKNALEFKKIAGIYTSYFIINFIITVITSLSITNVVVPFAFKYLYEIVNLFILVSCLLILIDNLFKYNMIESKVYSNMVMKLVYLIGDFISYPFLKFINNIKIINKKD